MAKMLKNFFNISTHPLTRGMQYSNKSANE